MEENVVNPEKQPKLWLAILCAIGMGLVGCVLWGLLYYWGYIAWAAAFAVVLLVGWAYKKFNLKMDVKGYIIISVISVIEVIVTMFISLNIAVMVEIGGEVGFFECFSLIFQVLGENPGIMTDLIVDIVLSLVMVGVGVLIYFFVERSSKKKASSNNSTQKADYEINDNVSQNEKTEDFVLNDDKTEEGKKEDEDKKGE